MTTEEIGALERVIAALGDAIEVMPENRHLRGPCIRFAAVLSGAIGRNRLKLAADRERLARIGGDH